MARRSVFLSLIFLTVASVASAAPSLTAVGAYGSFYGSTTGSNGGGLGLSLKFGTFPVIELEYNLANPRIGIAVDYWVLNDSIGKSPLSYYLGIGGFLGLSLGTNPIGFDPGVRLPLGLQFFPLKKLEVFLEGAPMIHLIPRPDIGFSASLGVRVHF